jgi:hypothetical protein
VQVSSGFDADAESVAPARRRDAYHDHFVSCTTLFTSIRLYRTR